MIKQAKFPRQVLLLLGTLLIAACSVLGVGDSGQIVFGESIEGLEIGDSKSEMVEKLGDPDRTLPADLAGQIYQYLAENSGRTRITVTISDDPAVGLGVVSVRVSSPYSGKTESGVGIGTPRSEVLESLGSPDFGKAGGFETYSYDDTSFIVEYNDERVHSISMAPATVKAD